MSREAKGAPRMRHVIPGYKLWEWPEFNALLKRLGVPDINTARIVIDVDCDGMAKITHEYYGVDAADSVAATPQEEARIGEIRGG